MGNSLVTGGFPSQRVSNVESISWLWRKHAVRKRDWLTHEYKQPGPGLWRQDNHKIILSPQWEFLYWEDNNFVSNQPSDRWRVSLTFIMGLLVIWDAITFIWCHRIRYFRCLRRGVRGPVLLADSSVRQAEPWSLGLHHGRHRLVCLAILLLLRHRHGLLGLRGGVRKRHTSRVWELGH